MLFYYRKQWHSGPPYDKKSVVVESDLPKPRYRPGFWVRFSDRHCCPDVDEFVGKVEYAIHVDGKTRYEIKAGYSCFQVPEKAIHARMIDKE
jgi:hypothetical protein